MPQLKSLTLLRLHPYSHYEVANYTALKLLASAEPEELELEFNDVEWSRFVGRQSEREARGLVETGWDVIPGLCSIADTVHVRQGIRESRFLQRPGWAVEIEGGDTSDEDESEYEATEPDEMGQDNGGNALTVSNDDSE
ncbi:hypothetical protein CFE70_009473 [Pyrenophora teres f. teres 0-1]